MQTFWLDEGVGSRVQLHQTIALVDSLNFRKHADSTEVPKDEDEMNTHPENELLLRQLVHADKILLNKVDLLEQVCNKEGKDIQGELAHICQCIAHVNKHALIRETTHAKADLDFLITKPNTDSNGLSSALKATELAKTPSSAHKDSHAFSHALLDSIKSVYVTLQNEDGTAPRLDKDKLEFLIGELLWEGPTARGIQVMRCKGVFVEKASGKAMILQGVEDLFEFREVQDAGPAKCAFLFVGKGNIEESALRKEIMDRCCKDDEIE